MAAQAGKRVDHHLGVVIRQADRAEDVGVECGGRLADQSTTDACDRAQRGAPVGGVWNAFDQAGLLEAVDGVGDAGGVHLEALTDPAERQATGAGEVQQHEHLEPGERQPERREGGIHPGEEYLVGAHDRRDQRHSWRGSVPACCAPVAVGLGDGVEGQRLTGRHEQMIPRWEKYFDVVLF